MAMVEIIRENRAPAQCAVQRRRAPVEAEGNRNHQIPAREAGGRERNLAAGQGQAGVQGMSLEFFG